jgi:hypothetical protein
MEYTMTSSEIDYGDFKIFVNVDSLDSKELKEEASKIGMETARREKMFNNGILRNLRRKPL